MKFGFEVCDTAPPYFELLVKKFKDAPNPLFLKNVRSGKSGNRNGLQVYYSNQCPFTDYYVRELEQIADERKIPFTSVLIRSKKEVDSLPSVFSIYSVFYNGNFITHEILNRNKFEKLWKNIK